jgi:hypothetical protein
VFKSETTQLSEIDFVTDDSYFNDGSQGFCLTPTNTDQCTGHPVQIGYGGQAGFCSSGGWSINSVWGCGSEYSFMDDLHAGYHYARMKGSATDWVNGGNTRAMEVWLDDTSSMCVPLLTEAPTGAPTTAPPCTGTPPSAAAVGSKLKMEAAAGTRAVSIDLLDDGTHQRRA